MLLSIPKKAVTEADASHILEQAYNLERPFGTPTIILNSEHLYLGHDFTQEYLNWSHKNNMFSYGSNRRPLSVIFSEALKKCPEFNDDDVLGIQTVLCNANSAASAVNDVLMGECRASADRVLNAQYSKYAHHYRESIYEPPAFNTIFIPRQGFSAHEWFASNLKATKHEMADYLPGHNSQYHFFILIHEMGHGAGAGEAQTDMMAAIACRQAFANTDFISAWSDIRALSLLYNMGGALQAQGYHWSMVEGLDHVIAMDQSTIDAMGEDDIKALRFKSFPHTDEQLASIQVVFDAASANGSCDFINAYKHKNLPALARTLQDLSTANLSDDTRIIASRLALAAKRLGTPGAYQTNPPPPGPR